MIQEFVTESAAVAVACRLVVPFSMMLHKCSSVLHTCLQAHSKPVLFYAGDGTCDAPQLTSFCRQCWLARKSTQEMPTSIVQPRSVA